jgi:hypothetical protein
MVVLRDYATRAAAEERFMGLLADEAQVVEHRQGRKVRFGELPSYPDRAACAPSEYSFGRTATREAIR